MHGTLGWLVVLIDADEKGALWIEQITMVFFIYDDWVSALDGEDSSE